MFKVNKLKRQDSVGSACAELPKFLSASLCVVRYLWIPGPARRPAVDAPPAPGGRRASDSRPPSSWWPRAAMLGDRAPGRPHLPQGYLPNPDPAFLRKSLLQKLKPTLSILNRSDTKSQWPCLTTAT